MINLEFKPERLNDSLSFGIAVSNLANEYNPQFALPGKLPELFAYLHQKNIGVEVQLESFNPNDLPTDINCSRPQFLGIHLPIINVDFIDPQKAEASFAQTENTLKLARDLKADYVVIHPVTVFDWDHLEKRPAIISQSLPNIQKSIFSLYHSGFSGSVYLENIEFPLYPATAEEIIELKRWTQKLSEQLGIKIGLALDIGHLWHSGILIQENNWRSEVIAHFSQDPFVAQELLFPDYLNNLVTELGGSLKLLHITNTLLHETHLPPALDLIPDAEDKTRLNLRQSLLNIRQFYNKVHVPLLVVNEAHGVPYENMIDSCETILQNL